MAAFDLVLLVEMKGMKKKQSFLLMGRKVFITGCGILVEASK